MNDTTLTIENTPPMGETNGLRSWKSELAKERAISQALRERVQQLEADLAVLKQAAKRQATPFARRAHVAEPKRPGRKAGQGTFARRPDPSQSKCRRRKRRL